MNRTFRTIIYTVFALGLLILIVTIAANVILKNKLETFIQEELQSNMVQSYDDLSVHSLDGSIIVTHPVLIIQNKEDRVKHTYLKAKSLTIADISYWDYFFNGKFHIGNILIENPDVAYFKNRVVSHKDSVPTESHLSKPIFIDHVKLANSKLAIYGKGKDSTQLYTEDFSFEIFGIETNREIWNKKMPFEYKKMDASGDSLFVKANAYDNLTVQNFSLRDRSIVFNKIRYYTKYSKAGLSRIINVQRDHYNLSIESLTVDDFNFGFTDSLFFAKSKEVTLDAPRLDIYRDKLVAEDPTIKPLYSKSLRELPFELTVDSVKINNAFLKYEEKVKEENPSGFIQFKNLNANMANVSNTYSKPEKTDIKIKALFMENTPISVNWSFDVQNREDAFLFQADVGPLDAEKMNNFTEPNLLVKLEGHANKTYFTIDGNNESSTTDIKINYSDFKVTVLQKDKPKKNKLLSAIVNIFVAKDSDQKESNFREGRGEATRNKTKSVFNLLWISVKSALQKSMM